ncbi:uncharacterized protein PG998_014498 [Apiospora kogelbergensis]|uniref:uncharacterized protein n=1 Tax=Apiospora kogelbergensis TaxID=1337665 RepID=UPI00312EBB1A
MGWTLERSCGDDWKAASAAAQLREDSIRGPGSIPKDEFWQPGEWGRWLDLEKKLHVARSEALRHRNSKVLGMLKEVIVSAYTVDADAKLEDQIVQAVARSIVLPLTFYTLLPSIVMVSTNEEKMMVLKNEWRQIVTERNAGGTFPRTLGDEELMSFEDENDPDVCAWTVDSNWNGIREHLCWEAMVYADGNRMESEETDRLFKAKESKMSTTAVLTQELAADVRDLGQYSTLWEELWKITHNDNFTRIYGDDLRSVHSTIDYLHKEQYFSRARADALKAYLSTEDRARLIDRMNGDPEWVPNPKAFQDQRALLESLCSQDFLARWLDLVYKRADAEQTEKVRLVNEKLGRLYAGGRKALDMNLA